VRDQEQREKKNGTSGGSCREVKIGEEGRFGALINDY
jgi:hypothetical protein